MPEVESVSRAAEFRRAFDDAFARPAAHTIVERDTLLAIRVGGDPFALRAREIAGLSKSSAIVPVPCATPALLGIMGLRGALLPIFDLAELLGYARPERAARWVAVCGGSQPLGLAFAQFEHCFQAGPSDLSSVDGAESRNHSHEVVRASGAVRHIVDIPSVVRVIRSVRAKGNLPLEKER